MRLGRFVLYFIIGVGAFIWLVKVPILSKYLTNKLRQQVSIEWVSIWPSETTIRDLKISNPQGFTSRFALEINTVHLAYQFNQLISNPSIIDLIECDSLVLNIEFLQPENGLNKSVIINDLMEGTLRSESIQLRKLILTNVDIVIRGRDGSEQIITQHLDRLEWDDIKTERGLLVKELIRRVFESADLTPSYTIYQ